MNSLDGSIILKEFGQKLTKNCFDSAFHQPCKVDFHPFGVGCATACHALRDRSVCMALP